MLTREARVAMSVCVALAACGGGGGGGGDTDAGPDTGCGDADLCIIEDHVMVLSGFDTCVTVAVENLTGVTVHLGTETFPATGSESFDLPGIISYCALVPKQQRADTELWLVFEDGRETNRIDAISQGWIDSITPAGAQPGDTITIHGGNFGRRQYPAGYGWLLEGNDALEVVRWSNTEIDARILAHSPNTQNLLIQKIDMAPSARRRPGEVEDPSGATYDVRPKIRSSCGASPGVRCMVVGGALGTLDLRIDDVPVVDFSGMATQIHFPLPALTAGPHTLEVTAPHGLSDTVEINVLGWTRATVTHLTTSTFLGTVDAEGTMHTTPQGGVVVAIEGAAVMEGADGTFSEISYGVGPRGFGPLNPAGGMPGNPFSHLNPSHNADGRTPSVQCERPRVAASATTYAFAARMGGPAVTDGSDGLPPRVCDFKAPYEIVGSHQTIGEASGYRGLVPAPSGNVGGTAGLVHVDGWTWLAVRNDTDQQTELYRHYGGGSDAFGREIAALPGRGALHSADKQVWLAGGEPGFDGIVHRFWLVEEQVGEPRVLYHEQVDEVLEVGIPASRQPLFAGADDGSLYAGYVSATGTFEIARRPPTVDAAWQGVASVPDTVIGVPSPATLMIDPGALEIVDMEVVNGRVYLLSQHDGGTGTQLRVYHQTAAGFVQTHEEIASWWPLPRECVGPYADATDECGSESGIGGCAIDECSRQVNSWAARPGAANRARMHAAEGALWVLYEMRYDDSVYNGVLGDDKIYVAKLAIEPTAPISN